MKFNVLAFIFIGIFLMSFAIAHEDDLGISANAIVSAQEGNFSGNETNQTEMNETDSEGNETDNNNKTKPFRNESKSRGIGQNLSAMIAAKKMELRAGNYTGSLGQLLMVKELSARLRELRSGNVSAKTELNLTFEKNNSKVKIYANLSNGRFAEIKIMPDTASETAIARLKLRVCTEENNCTIELKEVPVGKNASASYHVKAEKKAKVLGLFNAKLKVEAHVDAETGEVIFSKKPWWAVLSSEED